MATVAISQHKSHPLVTLRHNLTLPAITLMIREQCGIKLTADNSSLRNKIPKNFLLNWENNLPVTHCSIRLRHFLLEVQQKETGSGDFPQAAPTELIVLVREKER